MQDREPQENSIAQAMLADVLVDIGGENGPGCVCNVVRDGAVIASQAAGLASIEHRAPMLTSTPIYVGSISKQFMALVALTLHEDGILDLRSSIRDVLREFPEYGARITGWNLLTHTSGIRDYLQLAHHAGAELRDSQSPEQIHELILRQSRLDFPPGTDSEYSNSNYFLMGQIIERVSERSLTVVADKLIFSPLGMKSSRFLQSGLEVIPGRARGYHQTSDGNLELHEPARAVGLLTTMDDLVRWAQYLRASRLKNSPLISALTTPTVLANGEVSREAPGLRIDNRFGRKVIEHNGTNRGFSAHVSWYPADDLFVMVMCNYREARSTRLAHRVAARFLDARDPPARPFPELDVETLSRLQSFAGVYEPTEGRGTVEVEVDTPHAIVTLYGVHPNDSATGSNVLESTEEAMEFRLFGLSPAGRILFDLTDPATPSFLLEVEKAPATRFVAAAPVSVDRLRRVAGDFWSEDLRTTYRISERNGDFDLDIIRQDGTIIPRGSLVSVTERFFYLQRDPVTNIQIDWTEQSAVSGFLLSEPRLRDVEFRRVHGTEHLEKRTNP